MNFHTQRDSPTEGFFGASPPSFDSRNLLCFWPPHLGSNNLLKELTEAGWRILRCENSAQLQEHLTGKPPPVGLVLVDCSWDHADLQDTRQAIGSASQVTWYAVLVDRRPMSSAVCDLLAVYCDDFFSPPYDTRRIEQSLGHGAGMYLLRQRHQQAQLGANAFEGMIGQSELMTAVFRDIQKIARSDAPVLLVGESGTGKELAARAIHHLSRRADGPFKAVSCAAIPPSLMQSELFGHEKGAFDGADSTYRGRLESAQGGVLFLDEIGSIGLEDQVKLLHFLEDKHVERLGGDARIKLDVRVIAANQHDLEDAVRDGSFRGDLYYSLDTLRLALPSLRDRLQDIEALANFALLRFAKESGNHSVRGFSREAVLAMQAHNWPGNIRELINRVRRALVMCEGRTVGPSDLDLDPRGEPAGDDRARLTLDHYRQQADRMAIEAALRNTGHNISEAARQLDISRTTLYRMMERLSIRF